MPNKPIIKRITLRLLYTLDQILGRIYNHRHPGFIERQLISFLKPFVLRLKPNDKWNLHVFVTEWLKGLNLNPLEPMPEQKRIFMFCAYRIQFTQDLAMAVLMAWRGHHITLGYLPKLQSPIKEPLRDHRSAKPYLSAALSKVERLSGGRIRCVDLTDEIKPDLDINEDFIKRQVKYDVIKKLKKETLDFNDPEVAKLKTYYYGVLLLALQAATSHLQENVDSYDLCLFANGASFESAVFCHVAKELGIAVNSFEKFAFRFIRTINHGDHVFTFRDVDLIWELKHASGYDKEPFYTKASNRAFKLLNERRNASTETWVRTYQSPIRQSFAEVAADIGIDQELPFILICPNIPYDAGFDTLTTIFPRMCDWLVKTVSFLLKETDMHIVVRAHPGEAKYYGGERTEDILGSAGLLSERLTVISADKVVNTYCLIEKCQFGVVFSSTVGLEMAMMGKRVLVGSNVYYSRKGYTIDAADQREYLEQLKILLKGMPPLSPEQIKKARLYHFIFHFVNQWPYPYHNPSSIHQTPPASLIASSEIMRYIKTLDALSLDLTEWRNCVVDFIRADGDNHITEALQRSS